MSFGARVVVSLVAGLAFGALLGALHHPSLNLIVPVLEPLGTLWLNALRMTVIPLVISMLITGVASAAATATTGRIGARALALFAVSLTAAATLAALFTPVILAWWPVDPKAAAAFRASVSHAAPLIVQPPALRDFIVNLVPANPFKAAADGDLLPLVMFALLFGFAAARIAPALRAPLLSFFQAVMETLFVIVQWVLRAAPIGVFALTLAVGMRGGVGAAGVLGHYLIMMCAIGVAITLLVYPAVVLLGRVSLTRFVQAVAPAQAVAISTQSSLASLPTMIEAAQTGLGVSEQVTSITLPLAVSLFRLTSPLFNLALVIFVAHVYGVHLGASQLAVGVLMAVVTNLSVAGLPGQSSLLNTTVPISLAMGVPLDLLPLLVAIEVVPDIFRTLGNVTADVAATVIVARLAKS